jgi:DNA-binding transcriptional LysR family regulator
MHVRSFDMNLLPVFSALLTQGSVSRAAETLGLTQPAVSHALSRLRQHYNDPLFQRVRNRMVPTEKAREIAPAIDAALELWRKTLYADFKAAELKRTFRIGLVNYSGFYLLPALTERLCVEAPHVQIVPEQMGADAALRLMATKEIDFAVGVFSKTGDDLQRTTLIHSDCCVIMRSEHPLAGRVLTPELLAGCRQVKIPTFSSYDAARSQTAPDYAITCPDLLSVPLIIARSDLVAIVPLRLGRLFSAISRVTIAKQAFEFPPVDVDLLCQEQRRMDLAQQWLSRLILTICDDMDDKLMPYYRVGHL